MSNKSEEIHRNADGISHDSLDFCIIPVRARRSGMVADTEPAQEFVLRAVTCHRARQAFHIYVAGVMGNSCSAHPDTRLPEAVSVRMCRQAAPGGAYEA